MQAMNGTTEWIAERDAIYRENPERCRLFRMFRLPYSRQRLSPPARRRRV